MLDGWGAGGTAPKYVQWWPGRSLPLTKVNGAHLANVDVITSLAPCRRAVDGRTKY